MSLTPLTERQKTLIVNNIVKSCKNINSLNKTGYKYLYLASGFIAHTDMYGFIDFYSHTCSLKQDLVDFSRQNQWKNFRPGESDYEYYQAKADVYNRILKEII